MLLYFRKTAIVDILNITWTLVVRTHLHRELLPEVDCSCRVNVTEKEEEKYQKEISL